MTRPTSDIIFENMKPIIIENLGAKADKLTLETDFLDELGADSLDMVDLAMAFETKFLIEIEDKEIAAVRTVADAVRLIEEKQTPSGTLYQKVRIH